VSNWRRSSPAFRAALSHALEEKAMLRREQIEALIPAAVRLKAALAILDRAAAAPPQAAQASKALVTSSPQPETVHNLHNSAQSQAQNERSNPIPTLPNHLTMVN